MCQLDLDIELAVHVHVQCTTVKRSGLPSIHVRVICLSLKNDTMMIQLYISV